MIFPWFFLPYDSESQVFGDLAWLTSRLGLRAQRHGRTSQNQKSHMRFGFGAENWWESWWFSSHHVVGKRSIVIWNQIKIETSGSGILLKPSNLLQPWIFTEESGSSVASSALQGRISISNRFKQKILQTCCAWTWDELFDINNRRPYWLHPSPLRRLAPAAQDVVHRRFCGKFHVRFLASNQMLPECSANSLETHISCWHSKQIQKIFQKHTKTQGEPFFDPIIFAFLILQNSVFLNTWWLRPASRTLPHSEPKLWTCRVRHRAENNSRENSAVQLKKFIQIPWKFSWSSLPNKCKFHTLGTKACRNEGPRHCFPFHLLDPSHRLGTKRGVSWLGRLGFKFASLKLDRQIGKLLFKYRLIRVGNKKHTVK